MFARLGKAAGVSGKVVIYLNDQPRGGLLGTCKGKAKVAEINVYIDKNRKYPFWIMDKYHPHTIRIKTELDFICYVVAHELCHITYGKDSNFKHIKEKRRKRAIEWCCDEFAAKTINARVRKYGGYYPEIIGGIIGALIPILILIFI